jgi:undecaprenyl diphosphate synthase
MDGNGRWARKRGLPRIAGHRAGVDNLRRILEAAVEYGIKYLTIYAFSTENWGRPREEVDGLMHILEDVIDRELGELHQEGVKLLNAKDYEGALRELKKAEDLDPNYLDLAGKIKAARTGGRKRASRSAVQPCLIKGILKHAKGFVA